MHDLSYWRRYLEFNKFNKIYVLRVVEYNTIYCV